MKIPTDCAENLAVTMCGGRLKPHVVDGGCDTIRFEGIEDATVNQGVGIDLRDGITAYDGDGNEIEYEVEPSELAPCEVGEFDVEYRAVGKGLSMKPTVCGRNKVHAIDCGLDTVVEHRLITVTQADPPTISGVGETVIGENTDFDPLDGVSAVDDNGNVLEVEYSGKYLQEANGGIASFESEYEDPLHSLKVSLEPIQDLNGYDKPWAGGAGKNLIPPKTGQAGSAQLILGDDATAIASASGVYLKSGTYTLSVNSTKTSTIYWYEVSSGANEGIGNTLAPRTVTVSTDGYYFPFLYSSSGISSADVSTFQLEKGSSATSFEPYSNICPISGHTEVVTHRTGKNLWGGLTMANDMHDAVNNESVCAFGSDSDGGYITLKASAPVGNAIFVSSGFKENTQYTLILNGKKDNSNPASNMVFLYTDNSAGYINFPQAVANIKQTCVAVSAQGKTLKTVKGSWSSGESFFYYDECGLFEGVLTATAYEPYQGDTYTTDLGRTVYGGTLDVVSGELVVDRAMVDMGTLAWTYVNSKYFQSVSLTGVIKTTAQSVPNTAISSMYNIVAWSKADTKSGDLAVNNDGRISCQNSNYTGATAFREAMNGVQLCYELATPQTIQLTPTEVRTLLGTNNVWSDGIYHPLVKRYLKDNSWVGRYINGVMYYVNNGYGYLHTDTFKDAFVDCSHFAVKKFVSKPTDTSTPLADNALYLTDDGSLYVRYDAIEDADPTVSLQNWIDFVTDNNVYLTVPSYSDTASDSLDLTLQYNAPIPQGEAYQYIAQGTYTVTYRAVDQCGNETEVTRNITVGENIPVRRTVLRADGTLVINELASEYYANNEIYGAIVKEFEPYDEDNRYIFTLNNLPPWYADKNSITNVAIGEHIYPTQLDLWFYGLSNAETWELARLHTENATSMHRAFASAKVENLNFEELDTSNVTDFSYMFNGALSSQPIVVSPIDTSKGENFGSMFESANFAMLDVEDMDVSNALIMAGMFANCGNLTDLDLSSFIPTKCTDFSRMFYNCFRLQHLNLLNFHTPSAVLMNHMFGSNRAYQELDLSAFDTSNVTNMSGMFINTTVADPVVGFLNFDTSKVEDFSNMFTQALVGGGNDHYLDLSTWDTSSAVNMSQMFVAASIGILNIANFTTPNVTNMNLMFANSSSQMLQTIYCNNDFDLTNVGSNVQMFVNNPNLVGGQGTTYDASHITSEYARLDNPPSAPGYFTIAPDSDITNEEDIELTNEDDEIITT